MLIYVTQRNTCYHYVAIIAKLNIMSVYLYPPNASNKCRIISYPTSKYRKASIESFNDFIIIKIN